MIDLCGQADWVWSWLCSRWMIFLESVSYLSLDIGLNVYSMILFWALTGWAGVEMSNIRPEGVICPSSSNFSWIYTYSNQPESQLNSEKAQDFSCSPLHTTAAGSWSRLVGLTAHTLSDSLIVTVRAGVQTCTITPSTSPSAAVNKKSQGRDTDQNHLHLSEDVQ